MMVEDAIKHAEEVADKKEREKQKWEKWLETDSDFRAVIEKVSCELCAEEHGQLAEWLKELKRHREAWQKVKEELKEEMTGLDMFVEKKNTIRWCLHIIDNALGEVGEQNGNRL